MAPSTTATRPVITPVQGTNDSSSKSKYASYLQGYYGAGPEDKEQVDPYGYMKGFIQKPKKIRRSPLIHRGYFLRSLAIRHILNGFVSKEDLTRLDTTAPFIDAIFPKSPIDPSLRCTHETQIVAMGCGFDVTYFQMKAYGMQPTVYVDIDFPEVITRKVSLMQGQGHLWQHLSAETQIERAVYSPEDDRYVRKSPSAPKTTRKGAGKRTSKGNLAPSEACKGITSTLDDNDSEKAYLQLSSPDYHCIGVDLRSLATLKHRLIDRGLVDPTKPTLFLTECVMTYMEKDDANALIAWISREFSGPVAFLTYEQVVTPYTSGEETHVPPIDPPVENLPGVHSETCPQLPKDAFTTQMEGHFDNLSSSLKCLWHYPTLASEQERFRALGWDKPSSTSRGPVHSAIGAIDLSTLWYDFLPSSERQRQAMLEAFDEWEEHDLKTSHYYVLCAVREPIVHGQDIRLRERLGWSARRTPSVSLGQWTRLDQGTLSMNRHVAGTSCTSGALKRLALTEALEDVSLSGRWGHAMVTMEGNSDASSTQVLVFGGYDTRRHNDVHRLVFSHDGGFDTHGPIGPIAMQGMADTPQARMYHTTVLMNNKEVVLYGGRASPQMVFHDVWRWSLSTRTWQCQPTTISRRSRTPFDTAPCRYRHTANMVCNRYMVVIGGLGSDGSGVPVEQDTLWALDMQTFQWHYLGRSDLLARYSHSTLHWSDTHDQAQPHLVSSTLVLFGGRSVHYLAPSSPICQVTLRCDTLAGSITLTSLTDRPVATERTRMGLFSRALPSRYSHEAVWLDRDRGVALMFGGVNGYTTGRVGPAPWSQEPRYRRGGAVARPCDQFILVRLMEGTWEVLHLASSNLDPRMHIGMKAVFLAEVQGNGNDVLTGKLMVLGGGATCFSMGTWFDPVCTAYEINLPGSSVVLETDQSRWKHRQALFWGKAVTVPTSQGAFLQHYATNRSPAVFGGLLRDMDGEWGLQRLQSLMTTKDGQADPLVSVHVCQQSCLSFQPRNYAFDVMPMSKFSSLLERENVTQENEAPYMYLRSIGDNPRKQPSDIALTYPHLADALGLRHDADAHGPAGLSRHIPMTSPTHPAYFSSALRVSAAGLALWAHYDVMDNVLVHLSGRKRIILFPPNDQPFLSDATTDATDVLSTSSPLCGLAQDGDEATQRALFDRFPKLHLASPKVVDLSPGDVLFIPAMWWHHVTTLPDNGPAISVNIFWKHVLPSAAASEGLLSYEAPFYHRKDLYGNRDPVPFTQALAFLEKAKACLEQLPNEDYRAFYRQKLMTMLARE